MFEAGFTCILSKSLMNTRTRPTERLAFLFFTVRKADSNRQHRHRSAP